MNGSRRRLFFVACFAVLAGCASLVSNDNKTVLVGGATGRQGGAVVEELLARGYSVRAMTRNAESANAIRLSEMGAEVVEADYGDPLSLTVAMQGISKVFFYSGFSRNEQAEGKNVIDVAKRMGVGHLVYSSGAAAEPGKGLDGAKMRVELAIVASGLPYTVFRPVAFMENYAGQQKRIAKNGISDSRDPDRPLHFIAVRDIGLFVAEAFDNPREWQNKAVNIAGDKLTVQEHVDVFSKVMGQKIEYNQEPLEPYLAKMPKVLRPLFRWYHNVGYEADIEAFRARFPQLTTLEQYLRETGWAPGD